MNNSGQTATDIAKFWGYTEIANILDSMDLQSSVHSDSDMDQLDDNKMFFGHSYLDRAAHKRKDKDWLSSVAVDNSSIYILFNKNLECLVLESSKLIGKETKRTTTIYRGKYPDLKDIFDKQSEDLVFLGIDCAGDKNLENSAEANAWFAKQIRGSDDEVLKKIHPDAKWLQAFPGSLVLDSTDAGIFAQARSVLAWHDRYSFCPTCGKKTKSTEGGYKRECTDQECRSLKGVHNTCYPRVDPTVIMAVVSTDGKKLLLGRSARFPRGMFSCLAGFLEPGETLEAACRREVKEEAGVIVGKVQYHSCQPWPMPSSLMLGCIAHATSDKIEIDKEELEEARWFSRKDVIDMLNHRHPQGYHIPPEQAIAHVLIKAWIKITSNL